MQLSYLQTYTKGLVKVDDVLVDGSIHYVSTKILLEMIKVHSPASIT